MSDWHAISKVVKACLNDFRMAGFFAPEKQYSLSILKRIQRIQQRLFCLFDLILYVPSTIFQLNRDRSSRVNSTKL